MKERTEKMLPSQLLSHELLSNNGMRKERKHFLPKYFPAIGHNYSIRVTTLLYHTFFCFSIGFMKNDAFFKKTKSLKYNSISFFI